MRLKYGMITKNSTEISNLYNYGTITHPTSNNDTTLKVARNFLLMILISRVMFTKLLNLTLI